MNSTYESMDYMLTSTVEPLCVDTEMGMGAEEPEMREALIAVSDEEAESEDEGEIPTPPPLVRQAAVTGPIGRQGMSLREQEIRFIEEHGLVAFCHGALVTAILQDADYLRAQLVYLGK